MPQVPSLGLIGAGGASGFVRSLAESVARQKAEEAARQAQEFRNRQQTEVELANRNREALSGRGLAVDEGDFGLRQGAAAASAAATQQRIDRISQITDPALRSAAELGYSPNPDSFRPPSEIGARALEGLRPSETFKTDEGIRSDEASTEQDIRKARIQSALDTARDATKPAPGMSENQQLMAHDRLAKQWDSSTVDYRATIDAANKMGAGLEAARRGDMNAGSQAVLVTFQKILDPTSVVRESEYARSASGLSVVAQIEGFSDKLRAGGAGVTVQELERFATLADEFVRRAGEGLAGRRKRIHATADRFGLDPTLIFDSEAGTATALTADPVNQAAPAGRTNKYRDQLDQAPTLQPIVPPVVPPPARGGGAGRPTNRYRPGGG